jgi:hypothetical protein
VECLPFDNDSFDKALAINSIAGLREMRRGMISRSRGRVALGFTRYSGQPKEGLTETLVAAGFTDVQAMEQNDSFFGAVATKP